MYRFDYIHIVHLFFVGLVFAISIGCASSNRELEDAEAALQAAREAGAPELAPAEYEAEIGRAHV